MVIFRGSGSIIRSDAGRSGRGSRPKSWIGGSTVVQRGLYQRALGKEEEGEEDLVIVYHSAWKNAIHPCQRTPSMHSFIISCRYTPKPQSQLRPPCNVPTLTPVRNPLRDIPRKLQLIFSGLCMHLMIPALIRPEILISHLG